MESTTTFPYSGPELCGCGAPSAWRIQVLLYEPKYRCQACEDRFRLEVKWEYTNEHTHEDDIICPFCDYEHDDSWEIAEYDREQFECYNCGRKFDIEVHREVTYSTRRSDCEMPPDWNGEDD